ncbi:unnamed protein product [Adineta steineri]|uniref:Uncharacterized protein n=1 Tax=Adineta steineri TaxID=433720 RepID=A0A819PCF9_9BILA|nr:unnamed protein product [Adineta steineri]
MIQPITKTKLSYELLLPLLSNHIITRYSSQLSKSNEQTKFFSLFAPTVAELNFVSSFSHWKPIQMEKNLNTDIFPILLATKIPDSEHEYNYCVQKKRQCKYDRIKLPENNQSIIYEIYVADFFTENEQLSGILSKLDYLPDLGINVIALMPVQAQNIVRYSAEEFHLDGIRFDPAKQIDNYNILYEAEYVLEKVDIRKANNGPVDGCGHLNFMKLLMNAKSLVKHLACHDNERLIYLIDHFLISIPLIWQGTEFGQASQLGNNDLHRKIISKK